MPRGSEALTQARREEIINACAQLYETMGFKDVTIKEIGKITSFTRTSIYNYFQTKEEIFLALIGREFDLWSDALEQALAEEQTLDRARLAEILADTLSARTLMLKILSMNMFEIEENSSVEQLTAFKRTFGRSFACVDALLAKAAPELDAAARRAFAYALFPFMYGIYPYTAVTEKQRAAMDVIGFDYSVYTVRTLIQQTAQLLLAGTTPEN